MAILSTIKKGYLLIKTATGYVKLLPRTLATLVSMADGSTVESQITALKSSVSELNSNTTEILAAGVTLERHGKHRILHLINATSIDGTITTLSASDRPPSSGFTAIAIRGSATANLYASVDENGNVVAWNNSKRQSATSAIIGSLEWYVN